jgi:hypothetical protein
LTETDDKHITGFMSSDIVADPSLPDTLMHTNNAELVSTEPDRVQDSMTHEHDKEADHETGEAEKDPTGSGTGVEATPTRERE